MEECLPGWLWPPELLRWSTFQPAPGDPLCSFSVRQAQYPQCGMGYHCDIEQGRCILTATIKSQTEGSCPLHSGLTWSKSKRRCVQCLSSSIVLPQWSSSVAPSDYYRSGYVCDSDGNRLPPLAVNMSSHLYTDPLSFLLLGILICTVLSMVLHAFYQFSKRSLKSTYRM